MATRRSCFWCLLCGVLLGVSLTLQGCIDVYLDTCVWHSDLNIKGCSYFGFRHCIENCHYCVTQDGPDECGQLKCAAYCSQKDGDECLSNFRSLCQIAVDENFNTGGGCNVDCSAASRHAWPLGLAAALAVLVSAVPTRHALTCGVLLLVASTLHGCGCDPPEPQLSWTPEFGDFQRKAEWVTEDGIWRGNPSWVFTPHLEIENYKCKSVHPTAGCDVWTSWEGNCGEEDFGVCKCYKLSANENYCEAWGCHSLEANQEVCWVDSEDKTKCNWDPLPMNENTYNDLVNKQENGHLTTGQQHFSWWGFSPVHSHDLGRRMDSPGNVSSESSERALTAEVMWPPSAAYNPVSRHLYFNWMDVCIVNGDNIHMARHRCNYWREIETEISHCLCLEPTSDNRGCARWTCEERDVGLFSILFRTRQSITEYTHGSELEEYRCIEFDEFKRCKIWEGDISSPEEVEWTRCECQTATCASLDARWICDEYELPKTRDWYWWGYAGKICGFVFAEVFILCMFCQATGEASEDSLPVATCLSSCCGIMILPFLVVTLGAYGFMALGLPFWVLRFCCCCWACTGRGCCDKTQAVLNFTDATGDQEMQQPAKRSTSARLVRGSSKLLGRVRN